jgi:hypothetical protein
MSELGMRKMSRVAPHGAIRMRNLAADPKAWTGEIERPASEGGVPNARKLAGGLEAWSGHVGRSPVEMTS